MKQLSNGIALYGGNAVDGPGGATKGTVLTGVRVDGIQYFDIEWDNGHRTLCREPDNYITPF